MVYWPSEGLLNLGLQGGFYQRENVVGAIVVENATASGNGNLAYEPPTDLEIEFESMTDITFLYVSEKK